MYYLTTVTVVLVLGVLTQAMHLHPHSKVKSDELNLEDKTEELIDIGGIPFVSRYICCS
jgi:hypothetical protein